MFTLKTSKLCPFKMTKVLLRNAVLLLGLLTVLAIFVIAPVSRTNDLLSHSDHEIPRIGRHRPSFGFHRAKRDLWDSLEESETESICPVGKWPCSNGVCINQEFRCDEHLDCLDGSDEANCPELDEPQTGRDKKPLPLVDKDDTGGQQTDLDEHVSAVPTSSKERKTRVSGEDSNAYIKDINRAEGDDEDGYGLGLESGSGSGSGSGEIEESADTGINFDSRLKQHPDIDVKKPVPGLESRPGPETPTHFYRVTTIINEPYRQSLADRNSDEFREVSIRLSQAIDGMYQSALPDQRTHTKILRYVQTSDPFAIWVFLDVESTSPDVEKNRLIFAEQLQLHTLGNIRARPDGFSLRSVEDLEPEECEFETEFRCRSDGECITITARCDGISQCIDESDEADCSPLETATIDEVPEVLAGQCNKTEFLCGDDKQCIPLGSSCESVRNQCGVSNCITADTATTTGDPLTTTDPMESSLKAVEKKRDRIDDLIETVQRMNDALEELTTANKLLTQEIVKLQIGNAKRN